MIKPHLTFLIIRPLTGLLKLLEIAAVSWGLVIGMYIPLAGQPAIDISVRPDSLTVGDKFLYINEIEIPEGMEIRPVPPGDLLGDATVISEIERLKEPSENKASYACTLAVYKIGDFEIPSFTFAVTDSSGNTEEITGNSYNLTIYTVLPPDTSSAVTGDIADIREPYRIPGPVWPYIVIPIALALLIFGAYKLYHRSQGEQAIPQAPPRPPWEIAFESLDSLKSDRHYDFGRIKQYYFELSLIVREYLERRYSFPAVEQTTYELEFSGRVKIVGEKFYNKLFEFFNRADMAKFAKGRPPRNDAASDLALAYELVRETIPVIAEPEDKETKSIEAMA